MESEAGERRHTWVPGSEAEDMERGWQEQKNRIERNNFLQNRFTFEACE